MTSRRVKQYLGSIFFGGLIGAGLTGIAIIRGGLAHADPDNDKQFLYEVNSMATVIDGPDVIRKAREGCVVAMYEQDPHRIADIMWPFANTLTKEQIGRVAYFAAIHYCPIVLTYNSIRGGIVL